MLQRPNPRLVLASASASRRAVLQAAGVAFAIRPAQIDEAEAKRTARMDGASAEEAVLLLAGMKASQIALSEPDALVIGADQILVCDDEWFDKPINVTAAADQLRTLRGRTHALATAVLCHRGGQRLWHHVARPRLTMRPFSDAFLAAYLAAGGSDVTTTVGAYRLEGRGIHLFERIEGEQSAILGLPMLELLGFLRRHGVLEA
ncbi:MAG TPA: Maf family protein [Acetobacteraceae bacterium]|jgi:septum formation protein|nr:Maf family protein [Acetobacteraceae bacterium]